MPYRRMQRLVEGADDTVVPFADPHAPLTGVWLALTATVVLAAGTCRRYRCTSACRS